MKLWTDIAAFLRRDGVAALVSLTDVRGSSPRDSGTRMAVRADGAFIGTIGGGALEWDALAQARDMLAKGGAVGINRKKILGPDLGQCCGGQVELSLELFASSDMNWIQPLAAAEARLDALKTCGMRDAAGRLVRRLVGDAECISAEAAGGVIELFGQARTPVYLFGAGHVGRSVVLALATLPFRLIWLDTRSEMFPDAIPSVVELRDRGDPAAAGDDAPDGSAALVMTHSHPLDLAIISRLLPNRCFGYVGLIGSASKRARFLTQLRSAGLQENVLARLTCPVGGGLVRDKSPPAIAAAIAVELLQYHEKPVSLARSSI